MPIAQRDPRTAMKTPARMERPSADELTARAVARGDETAFAGLVDRHHAQLVRLAACYAADTERAKEIAREAWATAVQRMHTFNGSRSLKVWLAAILTETARLRAPVAVGNEPAQPALQDAFISDGANQGEWRNPPAPWDAERSRGPEARSVVLRAIAGLPGLQRQVITLRDVDGWSADEVSALLAISGVEQRRLLHRARTEVRAALDLHASVAAVAA